MACLGLPWPALACLGLPWPAWACLGLPPPWPADMPASSALSLRRQEFYLVDMPGYGFALAGEKDVARWQALGQHYLTLTLPLALPSPEPTPEPEAEPEPDRNANPEPGQALCQHYLQRRKTLKLVVVLVDGRTGFKRNDLQEP